MRRLFAQARLATPFRLFDGYLVSEDRRIAEVGRGDPSSSVRERADEVLDLGGRMLVPGFIDTHVHGGGGADVMDATPEALLVVARQHAAGGTTSFLPTTVCAPLEELDAVFEAHRTFRRHQQESRTGAWSLGLHLEGPYLNPAQAGALAPSLMRSPDPQEYRSLLAPENEVRRMTVAPELPGAAGLGHELGARGILSSIGHSAIRGDDLMAAMESGYRLLTHFYSGMEGVVREHAYRVAGLVEHGYLHDHLWVELIADGAHLPAELLRLVHKVKGASRIVLTTDAMRAAGLGPGEYHLGGVGGGRTVVVEDGVAKLPDRTAFAGSVALANRLVRTMIDSAGVPLLDALQMCTTNPARLLGLDQRKGALAPGMDADLVVLDDDLTVHTTLALGHEIYRRREEPTAHASRH